MSKKQQALLLSAPLFGGVHRQECHEFKGFACASCQGNGWHWLLDEFNERIKSPCAVCHGTGELKAVVTVEWQANK